MKLDIEKIRADFPILQRKLGNYPLVYLDNGATSQKPKQVIDALVHYYQHYNSNIHRGVHQLSQEATSAYEAARITIQQFIGAAHAHEIIFTKGTTDAINLVAHSFGHFIQAGDEILISAMEHHSNIVPWQMLCEAKGAHLKVIPMNDQGELLLDQFEALLSARVKLLAFTYVSNALGTINPVREMVAKAKQYAIPVLLDAAQAVQHVSLDVQELDVDFLVFSGHKILAETGIGVLYGQQKWLDQMPPYQGGGDMIRSVTFEKTLYNDLPYKFEAGTPNIAGAIALGAAVQYIQTIGLDAIAAYEHALLLYATAQLKAIPEVSIVGEAQQKASLISFVVEGCHALDVGSILDQMGVAVRTGHHCAQPVMDRLGIAGTVRASFAFYNSFQEMDIFVAALKKAIQLLR